MFLNRTLLLIAAEVLAMAVLHLVYLIRRDKALPKGSKVPRIKGKPVFKMPSFFKSPRAPHFSVAGWTPPPRQSNMPTTPDRSPDA